MKKNSIFFKIANVIVSIILMIFTGFLIYQIYNLDILPSRLLMSVTALIVLFIVLVLYSLNFYVRSLVSKIVMLLFTTALTVVFGVGVVYIRDTYQTLEEVSGKTSGNVRNNIAIVVKDSASMEELSDLSGATIGVLKNLDKTGTDGMKKEIKNAKLDVSYKTFDSVQAEVYALMNEEVDAIILNTIYFESVAEIEGLESFNFETKTVYTYSYNSEQGNEPLVVSDITTNPFTILISGNDSYGQIEDAARSDVNLIVTVNPTTSTVLMTSLPRDYYVPTICSDGACAFGAYDKLTHTGMYGTDTTIETIQSLLDIDINYTFRVNFSSAIDLVDALGGVDVYIEKGFEVEKFFTDGSEGVKEGWNHLDGHRALAFCRERKAYLDGDLQRARNQQQVLQAIIKKAVSSELIFNYKDLLKIMKGAFETNMSMNEITSLLKYEIQNLPDWKFENYVLTGVPEMMPCASMGDEPLSVFIPDSYSIQLSHDKIQAVLDGLSSETVVDESGIEAQGSNPDYDYDAAVVEELLAQGYSYEEIELYFQGLLDTGEEHDTYHENGE